MNIYPLVFSNNSRYRITRHVLFWTTWILYYTYFETITWKDVPFWKAFFASLFEQVLSTPLDMAFCYAVIYFLIPRYLMRGQYITMVVLWLLFSVLFVIGFRFFTTNITPLLRAIDGLPVRVVHSYSFTWAFFELFSQINMEGCIAASIKLGKMWYIKQQELSLLKSEKQKIEPAQPYSEVKPGFLMDALDQVEVLSQKRPSVIPGMIRKIKKLLVYVIYENNQSTIGLEKEISMLKEYMELEKESANGNLQVKMNIDGNISGERIAPFLILSLVENSFHQLAKYELPQKCLRVDISLNDGQLQVLVAWSKPIDTSTLANGSNTFLRNINKRLNLLYPQSHELKALIKTDQIAIQCKIGLHEAVN